jgi:hypothetical protein
VIRPFSVVRHSAWRAKDEWLAVRILYIVLRCVYPAQPALHLPVGRQEQGAADAINYKTNLLIEDLQFRLYNS